MTINSSTLIAFHTPFGALSQESGTAYLLARYLRSRMDRVKQLTCNGAFSLCDRDSDSGWRRSFSSCLGCSQEQRALAAWSELEALNLTAFLPPQEADATRRWVTSLDSESLTAARYEGVPVADLVRGSFRFRLGVDEPDLKNKQHEDLLRRLLLAGARMSIAARRFFAQQAPELCFVAGGVDYLSATLRAEGARVKQAVAVLRWDVKTRAIRVLHPQRAEDFVCPLVVEDVTAMRNDCRTWPPEIIGMLEQLCAYLELSPSDLVDRAAKAAP